MFTVYVLYTKQHNKLYIGMTSKLEQRLLSHNKLAKKGFTVRFRPWTLIHTETFDTKNEALLREKKLKGGQGRQWIRAQFISKF